MDESFFSDKDLAQFETRGITAAQVERQLTLFRQGFPFADIRRPATPGDGILLLDSRESGRLAAVYETGKNAYSLVKFVPASGAASRMFKSLFAYHEAWKREGEKKGSPSPRGDVKAFIDGLERFAFFGVLEKELYNRYGATARELRDDGRYGEIIETLLFVPGLDYGSLPKGLILFHRYPEGSRTAFEEHLVEGARYAVNGEGHVLLHFTVSPEHMKAFRNRMEEVRAFYEARFNVRYDVSWSVQKPSTDTLGVTPENEPFRKEDGSLLFRPGGHGALIENLNDLKEDVIFIKNIDNVVPDRLKDDTVHHKKVLGGLLLELLEERNVWLKKMDGGQLSADELNRAVAFAGKKLMLHMPEDFSGLQAEVRQSILYGFLHRPLRVCGMVRNAGEPGGGPFWVADTRGRLSLQIVELAQIDMQDPEKKKKVQEATHFNPVDLVCAVKDHKGEKFDLREYVDPDTYFISSKSYDGKELKALELPGLWNGAMARWTTLFVEVPPSTFNPVKTVNDLLRPEHAADSPKEH